MTPTYAEVQPLHSEVMTRIEHLADTSTAAAVSTARAYVDSMLAPVRASGVDLQNLIDTADHQSSDITQALKSLNRTMWFLAKLPGMFLRFGFAQARITHVAGECTKLVQDCAVPVTAYGVVAQSATDGVRSSAAPNAELLQAASKSKRFAKLPECASVLAEGGRTLQESSQLLSAQASMAENLRGSLMTALRQLEEASNALQEAVTAAESHRNSLAIASNMRRVERKAAVTRGRLGLQRALSSLPVTKSKAVIS